ncbi:hypothetical protein AGR9A_Cc210258 [Agrobacterium salinitolerans str. Hayward 0363]|nr:hypothetical protein AGR9A_Cc210258 [Agrobacterium salinitolerans str. Hayward 0363]
MVRRSCGLSRRCATSGLFNGMRCIDTIVPCAPLIYVSFIDETARHSRRKMADQCRAIVMTDHGELHA